MDDHGSPQRAHLGAVARRLLPSLLVISFSGCTVGGGSSDGAGATTNPAIEAGSSRQLALVEHVVDGDTFDVSIDGRSERVRLIGIDTPEQGECLHAEATRSLQTLLETDQVELVLDTTDRDGFGRLLRYAWVADTFVNEAQVRRGFALARRYPPDVAEADRLEAAETSAIAEAVGRWELDACGSRATNTDGSPTQLRIDHIEFDAPGDDSLQLNGEWLRIVNDGASAIDLDGWLLRDGSVSHRYRFPPITLPPDTAVTIYSGCGADTATELFWCTTNSAIWNNDGDTAYLIDPAGNIVTSLAY